MRINRRTEESFRPEMALLTLPTDALRGCLAFLTQLPDIQSVNMVCRRFRREVYPALTAIGLGQAKNLLARQNFILALLQMSNLRCLILTKISLGSGCLQRDIAKISQFPHLETLAMNDPVHLSIILHLRQVRLQRVYYAEAYHDSAIACDEAGILAYETSESRTTSKFYALVELLIELYRERPVTITPRFYFDDVPSLSNGKVPCELHFPLESVPDDGEIRKRLKELPADLNLLRLSGNLWLYLPLTHQLFGKVLEVPAWIRLRDLPEYVQTFPLVRHFSVLLRNPLQDNPKAAQACLDRFPEHTFDFKILGQNVERREAFLEQDWSPVLERYPSRSSLQVCESLPGKFPRWRNRRNVFAPIQVETSSESSSETSGLSSEEED